MEFELLTSLSPSRAADFKVCPQLFKFRALDKLEEPKTIYQARGTTAHLALQNLFDLPAEKRTPDALSDLFREAWADARVEEFDGMFTSIEEERVWGIESLDLLANYFTLEDPRAIEPMDRELDMTEELGDLTIRESWIASTRPRPVSWIITDYKSGKAPPERYAIPPSSH